jgi:hypothetical protein
MVINTRAIRNIFRSKGSLLSNITYLHFGNKELKNEYGLVRSRAQGKSTDSYTGESAENFAPCPRDACHPTRIAKYRLDSDKKAIVFLLIFKGGRFGRFRS